MGRPRPEASPKPSPCSTFSLLERRGSEVPDRGDFGEENCLGKGGVDRAKKRKKGCTKKGGLQNSPHKIGVWWVARLKFSISLENFKFLKNLIFGPSGASCFWSPIAIRLRSQISGFRNFSDLSEIALKVLNSQSWLF